MSLLLIIFASKLDVSKLCLKRYLEMSFQDPSKLLVGFLVQMLRILSFLLPGPGLLYHENAVSHPLTDEMSSPGHHASADMCCCCVWTCVTYRCCGSLTTTIPVVPYGLYNVVLYIYICFLPFLMKLKLSLDSTILDLGIQEYSACSGHSRQFFFRNAIDSWEMKVYPMNKSQRPYTDLKFFPTSGAHCLSNTGQMSNFEWLTQCRMRIARWVSDGLCTWSAHPQKELRSRIKWSRITIKGRDKGPI